jgi:hypothetical protein
LTTNPAQLPARCLQGGGVSKEDSGFRLSGMAISLNDLLAAIS